ncbi:hypothetical protein GUY44_16540 [Pimelobacter simplex]|uniref:hypothetical protein n=1 Tax=Nocardioides simplex TaxID=2045 RepID=UPI00116D89FC|nr:hypothetical protein [Pimelobacter simplex]MCG8152098.1 hypothetical protein [Pimelobacter simplex]GEB12850.1 hypothetical protein NSI01_11650 [Pimelobacter simplex]
MPIRRSRCRCWTVASALVGTTRAMTRQVQEAAAAGTVDARMARRLLASAGAALDVIETGLAGTTKRRA